MGDPEDQGASEQGEARRGFEGTPAALGAQAEHSGFPCAFKHAVSPAANERALLLRVNHPPQGRLLLLSVPACFTPHPPRDWCISLAGKRVIPTGSACSTEASPRAGVQRDGGWQALTRPGWRLGASLVCPVPQEPLPSRASPARGSGTWCVSRRLEPKPPHLQARLLRLPPGPAWASSPADTPRRCGAEP